LQLDSDLLRSAEPPLPFSLQSELRLLSILENWALIALQFIKIHQRYMRLLQSLCLIYITGEFK